MLVLALTLIVINKTVVLLSRDIDFRFAQLLDYCKNSFCQRLLMN